VGFYSTNLVILQYSPEQNTITQYDHISNACSDVKVGIPAINYISFNKVDMITDINQEYKIVCTGGYDYRIRIYNIEEKKSSLQLQGSLTILNNVIIHQIQLYEDYISNNLYLFIASEQKLFLIYLIA
jgi:hypothetical protein